MTIQKSVMMSNTGDKFDVTGDKFRADGYWGHTDGLHTISISSHNLIGNLHIQGTLSMSPEPSDWFDIDINPKDHRLDYLKFEGSSGVLAVTLIGNFGYLRAVLDRTNSIAEKDQNGLAKEVDGQIDRILLAM